MSKWLREHLRIILIIYIVEAAAMAIAGLVIALMYDFSFGSLFILLLGLFQLFVGIWLFKRQGKGILG